MTPGSTYKLDNLYLKCTRVLKSGICSFKVCNKNGVIRKPIYKNGFITDHGVRIVSKRINELIEV